MADINDLLQPAVAAEAAAPMSVAPAPLQPAAPAPAPVAGAPQVVPQILTPEQAAAMAPAPVEPPRLAVDGFGVLPQPNSSFAIKDPAVAQQVFNYGSEGIRPADGLQQTLANMPPEVADAATMPTYEQMQAEFAKLVQPYQQAKAEMGAMNAIDRYRKDMEKRDAERQAKLDQDIEALDGRVRQKSLNEIMQSGSWGAKIGAALSVLAGGVSQGLTGAKSNPVVDYMDRVVDAQAKRDSLTLQEKESLRKQVYEKGQQEIAKLGEFSQNAFRKDQLALMSQELDMKKQELMAKLRADVSASMPQDAFSGRALAPQEALAYKQNPKTRDLVVPAPNGKFFLAANDLSAKSFKEVVGPASTAIDQIKLLKNLAAKGSSLSKTDRLKADGIIQSLIGALRLPFTGPGILTLPEREALADTIGNPLALYRIKDWEMAKLDQVEEVLKSGIISTARMSGITGDVLDNERFYRAKFNDGTVRTVSEKTMLEKIKEQHPGKPDDVVLDILRRTVKPL